MKFVKGIALGAIITAGAMMMYSEDIDDSKKRMLKKGKQLVKKMKVTL